MSSSASHSDAPSGAADWRVWLQAIRPFSFTASITPIVIAAALAVDAGAFDVGLAVLMLVASIACHAGANLANDYYDHVHGVDSAASLGPSKVIQQDKLHPATVRVGMLVAFAVATLVGLIIVAIVGWPILALALASLAVAYAYTGGPRPLGYVALGEVAVFLSMGLGMVLGAFYVFTRTVTPVAVVAAVAGASLVAAILHVNNIRDADSDRAAGKRTLAILLGRQGSTVELTILVAAAYAAVLSLPLIDRSLWPALLAFLSIPAAVSLISSVAEAPDAPALNAAVRRSARLHLRFGLLLAVGILLATVLRPG